MTPEDEEALRPILKAVAVVVLTRPAAGGLPSDPDLLVKERTPLLVEALRRSAGVRRRAADALARSAPSGPASALAALILHPDTAVVGSALTWLELAALPAPQPADPPARDRRADRMARKVADLKQKLTMTQGRLDYARQDITDARELIASLRTCVVEGEERAERLEQRLDIAQRRLADPRSAAAALLAALEARLREGGLDAEFRDPRNVGAGVPRYDGLLTSAAEAVDMSPDEVLGVLRALVAPLPAVPRAAAVAELDLTVTPLGGDREIGGSCLLIEAGGTRILVDAGLYPGDRSAPPRDIGRALEKPLHGVVVTHAHNDHCGYVPALVTRNPDLRVLATPETVQLMPVMWNDAAKLMRRRTLQLSDWGTGGAVLFDNQDVDVAAGRCEELPFGVARQVGELTIELFPAGHILGAAGVVVRAGDRRVVVTGDISGFRQESVEGYCLPESARDADLLVMESTCCADDHDPRDRSVQALVRSVQEICQAGGRVLIPAFALGRAQEIALIMRRHLPEVPIRVDGMATELSSVFESATREAARPLEIFGGAVAVANRPTELTTFRAGVIVTTSGMLTGGPAVQWARRILPEPGSALFISGYQDEESPGARLLRLADHGGDFTLMDHDEELTVPVRARVATMRLSAHADRRGLLDIAAEVRADQVMLVHGVPRRQDRFRQVLGVREQQTTPTAPWRAS